jgi:hypothetical protein
MKEDRRETRAKVSAHTSSNNKAQKKTVPAERPIAMPNPLKGLQLSLYPIIKEH